DVARRHGLHSLVGEALVGTGDVGDLEFRAAPEFDAGVEADEREQEDRQDDERTGDLEPGLAPADDVVRPFTGVELVTELCEAHHVQFSPSPEPPDTSCSRMASRFRSAIDLGARSPGPRTEPRPR